jgi:beta-glucosidase
MSRLVFASTLALLSGLTVTTSAAVPASASSGTQLTSTPLAHNCPWVDPAVMATHTSAQLAAMAVARMTVAQKVTLLNLSSGTNHSPQNIFFGAPSLCIPALTFQDGPTGITLANSVALPDDITLGATFDPAMSSAYGAVIGSAAKANGVAFAQAPNLNSTQMPTWGRANETFGEDPFLISELSYAQLSGIQSQGVQAIVKHAGAYLQEYNRMHTNMSVPLRAYQEVYLSPFRHLMSLNPAAIMCAYGLFNGTLQCANKSTFTSINQMGFNGFYRSDLSAADTSPIGALIAGMSLVKPDQSPALLAGLKGGGLSKSTLDAATVKVVATLFAHGLITHPPTFSPTNTITTQALNTAVAAAEEGAVLLKNTGSLPLTTSTNILVLGAAADAAPLYDATGSSLVPKKASSNFVSPLDGLRKRYGTANVKYLPVQARMQPLTFGAAHKIASNTYQATGTMTLTSTRTITLSLDLVAASSQGALMVDGVSLLRGLMYESSGVHGQDQAITLAPGSHTFTATWTATSTFPRLKYADVTGLITQAATAAATASTPIVVVSTREGENYDRASLSLPDYQDQLITAVAAANPRTVVVINSGGAVTMPWLASVSAVVEAWLPGQVSGTALAAVLSGAVNPSGKLPVTFPASTQDTPYNDFTNGSLVSLAGPDGTGLLNGASWYHATNHTPLFPFGYGLSYTNFSLDQPSVTPTADGWTVTVRATNTGSRSGRVVAQGYVTYPGAAGEPARQLRCFGSTTLASGESQVITMAIRRQSLETYQHGTWTPVSGSYLLELGQSSTSLPLSVHFTN